MVWIVVTFAASVGGAIGWWLGAFAGGAMAFIVSLFGTAAGVYFARRFVAQYLS